MDTYVVRLQVWVVLLEAVVEDCYYDSLASEAHLPSGLHVQVEAVACAAVLFRLKR